MTAIGDFRRRGDRSLDVEPGDRIGVCLDVDGTIYRSGSVFVETLGYLPFATDLSIDDADERRLRAALSAVAGYRGGRLARVKWTGVFSILGALSAYGGDDLPEAILARLIDRRSERSADGSGRALSRRNAPGDYWSMQRDVLAAYGGFLRGRDHRTVERAIEAVVADRCPIDPSIRDVLEEIAPAPETDLALVTDMPAHVATAYAEQLSGEVPVAATTYEIDADGRYTGRFETVGKNEAVADLRAARDWSHVVAAGDSVADLPMAEEADVFLAVAGQGNIAGHLDGRPSSEAAIDRAEPRAREPADVVRVAPDERLAPVLRDVLPTVDRPNP